MHSISTYLKHRLKNLALPHEFVSWVCKEHRSALWVGEIPSDDPQFPNAIKEQCYIVFKGELSVVMMDMLASEAGLDPDALCVFYNATTKGTKMRIDTKSNVPCLRVNVHEGASARELDAVEMVRDYAEGVINSTRTALTAEIKDIYDAGLHNKTCSIERNPAIQMP
ncbi:hypothetical protein [Alteromonas gracilis]|uniref:hypothetical protein n=1 Tax=Alteromonas gracilis TaxID=1479524 RepID=UPI0037357093